MLDKLALFAFALSCLAAILAVWSYGKLIKVRHAFDELAKEAAKNKEIYDAEVAAYNNYNEVLEISNVRLRDAINFMKVRVPDIDMGSVEAIIRGDKIW